MEMDGIDIDSLKANMHSLVVKIVQFIGDMSVPGGQSLMAVLNKKLKSKF